MHHPGPEGAAINTCENGRDHGAEIRSIECGWYLRTASSKTFQSTQFVIDTPLLKIGAILIYSIDENSAFVLLIS